MTRNEVMIEIKISFNIDNGDNALIVLSSLGILRGSNSLARALSKPLLNEVVFW